MYFCNARRWKNIGEYDFSFIKPDPEKLRQETENIIYKVRNSNFQDYKEWLEHHVHKFGIDIGEPEKLTWIELDLWEARMVDEITRHRVREMLDNTSDYAVSTRDFFFKNTGIYSTSLVKDSPQLWGWKQNYKGAERGNAVCIGLDLGKVKAKLDSVGNYSLGMVNYKSETNEVDFLASGSQLLIDRLNRITFSLNESSVQDLTEQEEFRMLRFLTGDASAESPDRFLKLDPDCITEIIVHVNASNETKHAVEAIAKAMGVLFTISSVGN
jgi:hypothetical protein